MECPPIVILPESNCWMPTTDLSVVVLPAPLWTDEAVDLPRRDVERKIVHGLLFAEGLGQVFNIEHKVLPLFFLQSF